MYRHTIIIGEIKKKTTFFDNKINMILKSFIIKEIEIIHVLF